MFKSGSVELRLGELGQARSVALSYLGCGNVSCVMVRQVWSVVVVWGWVCLGQAGTVGVGELRYVGEGWGKVSQGRQGELCLFPFWYVG